MNDYTRIKLKNGYLIYKTDDFTLIESASENNNYAGVVGVKYSDFKQHLFVSVSPIGKLTIEEEDALQDMLCLKIPELANIKAKEINPIFTADGKLKNLHEWILSPKIYIREIKEVGSEQELINNVGIIRRSDDV